MTSYWIAWHQIITIEWLEWQYLWPVTESHDIKKGPWMTWMTIFMTSYWSAWHLIMTIEWLEWQYLWPATESHDIIYWPLNDMNDNLDDKLLNHMTYNDQWTTSMTNLMTRYWNAWHHIMNIKWLEWQSLWPVTESRDII